VFSLVNAPFVYGYILVWLLVSQLRQPPWRLRAVAVPVGCVALGLSQVRAAWLTLAVVAVLLVARRLLRLDRLLLIVGVLAAALLLLPESLTDVVTGRAETLESADSDVSFVARVNFYSHVLPQVLADPLGGGMGSSSPDNDSSYLEILRSYGGICGAILLVGLLWVVLATWWRTRRDGGPPQAWATFLVVLPLDMALGNVIQSVTGAITWLTIALCAAGSEPSRPVPGEGGHTGQRPASPAAAALTIRRS
jgi:O-antigen ligase